MTLVRRPHTKVAVIGAGLAGLTAARRLVAAGNEVTVYEARDRVGGRAFTTRDGIQAGQHADLGPELIGADYHAVPRLAAEVGVELSDAVDYEHPGAPPDENLLEAVLEPGRLILDGELVEGERFDTLYAELREAMTHTPAAPQEVLGQWARRARLSPDAYGALNGVARLMCQADLNQLDGHFVFGRRLGAVRRVVGGTQRLAEALADGLDVRLSTPVRTIRQAGGIFVITESGDSERYEYAIVTPPFHALATIGFDPPLETDRLAALNAFQAAVGGKVVGQYEEGDAVRAALSRACVTNTAINSLWVSNPYVTEGPAVVTGFVCGVDRKLLESPDAAFDALDALVTTMARTPVTRIGGTVKDWTADRWALAVTTTPGESQRGELVPRVARANVRIHFAGDYADILWSGTMEGAVRSGTRAADEILRRPARIPLNEIDAKLVRT